MIALLFQLGLPIQAAPPGERQDTGLRAIVDAALYTLQSTEPIINGSYCEYTLLSRTLSMVEGIDPRMATAIDADPTALKSRCCWARNGSFEYWEQIVEAGPKPTHLVAWSNGEQWTVVDVISGNGTLTNDRPALYWSNPANYFQHVHEIPHSQRIITSTELLIAVDPRFSHSIVYRIELPTIEFPPSRVMLALDSAIGFRPKRVYTLHDDLLTADYELRSVLPGPDGSHLPGKYRTILWDYRAENHFPVVHRFFEIEVEVHKWSQDAAILRDIGAAKIPSGMLVFSEKSEQYRISGADDKAAFESWSALEEGDTDFSATKRAWHWESALQGRGGEQAGAQQMVAAPGQFECGPSALFALLLHAGRDSPTRSELAKLCKTDGEGTSAANLLDTSEALGYPLVAVKLASGSLPPLQVPFVGVLKAEKEKLHYVTFVPLPGIKGAWQVEDYPVHKHQLAAGESFPGWSGTALMPNTAEVKSWIASERARAMYRRIALSGAWAVLLACISIVLVRRLRKSAKT